MSAEGGRGDEGKGVEGGVFAGKGAYNECKRYQEAGEGKQHEDAEWERHPACSPAISACDGWISDFDQPDFWSSWLRALILWRGEGEKEREVAETWNRSSPGIRCAERFQSCRS